MTTNRQIKYLPRDWNHFLFEYLSYNLNYQLGDLNHFLLEYRNHFVNPMFRITFYSNINSVHSNLTAFTPNANVYAHVAVVIYFHSWRYYVQRVICVDCADCVVEAVKAAVPNGNHARVWRPENSDQSFGVLNNENACVVLLFGARRQETILRAG